MFTSKHNMDHYPKLWGAGSEETKQDKEISHWECKNKKIPDWLCVYGNLWTGSLYLPHQHKKMSYKIYKMHGYRQTKNSKLRTQRS